jgi:predicted deacylase
MMLDEILIGKSTEGNPIRAHVADGKWSKYVYFIGGIQGDEVEGVYILEKLIEELSDNLQIEELPIIVIPIFNIDGHMRLLPHNSIGIDLDHHFLFEIQKNKHTAESQVLINLTKKYPPSLVINFTQGVPRVCYMGESAKFVANHIGKQIGVDVVTERQTENPERICQYFFKNYGAGSINIYLPLSNDETPLKEIWQFMKVGLLNLFRNNYLKKYNA